MDSVRNRIDERGRHGSVVGGGRRVLRLHQRAVVVVGRRPQLPYQLRLAGMESVPGQRMEHPLRRIQGCGDARPVESVYSIQPRAGLWSEQRLLPDGQRAVDGLSAGIHGDGRPDCGLRQQDAVPGQSVRHEQRVEQGPGYDVAGGCRGHPGSRQRCRRRHQHQRHDVVGAVVDSRPNHGLCQCFAVGQGLLVQRAGAGPGCGPAGGRGLAERPDRAGARAGRRHQTSEADVDEHETALQHSGAVGANDRYEFTAADQVGRRRGCDAAEDEVGHRCPEESVLLAGADQRLSLHRCVGVAGSAEVLADRGDAGGRHGGHEPDLHGLHAPDQRRVALPHRSLRGRRAQEQHPGRYLLGGPAGHAGSDELVHAQP
ncbi:MAG: hypothetical protein BWX79_02929 [Alphaproteobacteria bacterium ADurb.Bin100]|nr:MAG: hypothetical protein BWX79_02929 [Alphaproteobacteria bacterium ADurb.Bin100]